MMVRIRVRKLEKYSELMDSLILLSKLGPLEFTCTSTMDTERKASFLVTYNEKHVREIIKNLKKTFKIQRLS